LTVAHKRLTVYSLLLARAVFTQTLAPSIEHLTVAVHGCDQDPDQGNNGLGFIVGERPQPSSQKPNRTLLIVTAGHVVGPAMANVRIKLFKDGGWGKGSPTAPLPCSVIASEISPDIPPRSADYALVSCEAQATLKLAHSYNVLGKAQELRPRAQLLVSVNASAPVTGSDPQCQSPSADALLFPSYFVFDKVDHDTIEFFNPLQLQAEGASGGPLVTDRSEFVGMVYEARGITPSDVRAFTWEKIQSWLYGLPKSDFDRAWIKVKPVSRSAAELQRVNIELSAAATSLYAPNFGWLQVAPQFRVSTALPGSSPIRLAFDFISTQGVRAGGAETLSLIIPSITTEVHLGALWSVMRRHQLLGGVYLAGGVASTKLQRTLNGLPPTNITALTGVFDAGWRYRFPGRGWGVTASYREGILFENSVENSAKLYPRFRAPSFGMFVVFK
jgi:hypothetical protein